MLKLDALKISGKEVLPLIEGGKGIAISNGKTSGAWASAGCVGTFSAVNADSFDDDGNVIPQIYYAKNRKDRQREMIEYAVRGGIAQAKIAREISGGNGVVHVNILWEMGGSEEIIDRVLCGAKGCIDGVTCGAGMPYKIAEIATSHGVYYYPIVSSARAFQALYKRSYIKYRDFLGGVVFEDPWRAGGHNGLSNSEDPRHPENSYFLVKKLRCVMNSFNLSEVPIIVAGGVWWLSEWEDWINNSEIGPVAFQFGTRPILTQESPVAHALHNRLMTLKNGDVELTKLSPTGFYSSAIANKFLTDLIEREKRQVKLDDNGVKIIFGKRSFNIDNSDVEKAYEFLSNGYDCVLPTPDNTLVFVTSDSQKEILHDIKNCVGCLSNCRFSSWSQNENNTTGRLPDPRSFCIQKALQNFAHGKNLEDVLIFAGHSAYRFAEDPFYDNGYIPTINELIERILTGY